MPETDDIREFADSIFNAMIASANMGITPPMTFAVREKGQVRIEGLPEQAGRLLSIGAAKDEIFRFWRHRCANPAVDAFACGSEAWGYEENKVGVAYRLKNPTAHRKLIDHGFVTLLRFGHGTRYEMFGATAQTRERVLLMNRRFVRKEGVITWTHEPEIHDILQSEFRRSPEDVGRLTGGES